MMVKIMMGKKGEDSPANSVEGLKAQHAKLYTELKKLLAEKKDIPYGEVPEELQKKIDVLLQKLLELSKKMTAMMGGGSEEMGEYPEEETKEEE